MIDSAAIKAFYEHWLPNHQYQGHHLIAPCPFCAEESNTQSHLTVFLNPESHFCGLFRCRNHCTPSGFWHFFGNLMKIEASQIPGFDPDYEPYTINVPYPVRHIGNELTQFQSLLGQPQIDYFNQFNISSDVIGRMRIGFNGRYLVHPYFQENGMAYSAHCIIPGRPQDHFWHGNEQFGSGEAIVYNAQEIANCRGGALIVTDSELNLLVLKSIGYTAIAVPNAADLNCINPQRLAMIETVFLLVSNSPEARAGARNLATSLGFKARILIWPAFVKRDEGLTDLIAEHGRDPAKSLSAMLHTSKAFSPFSSPEKESGQLQVFLAQEKGRSLLGLETGFTKLDHHLEGLRGINILGGRPKVGKSCFFMQISTEVARSEIPVIYYDFENGRQKIYLRTLVRLSRIAEKKIRSGELSTVETEKLQKSFAELTTMLRYFKVVTDRQLTPDTVRRHIDFVKHETRKDQILIVIDSLHKLPFQNLTERRSGIDAWLRWLEAIRDEERACFLVISELSRSKDGGYGEKPDLSAFKESGDIEYSADNALILTPNWDPTDSSAIEDRKSSLWVVASRESTPGLVTEYGLDYPFWNFNEL